MKKIIILLMVAMLLAGCNSNIADRVNNKSGAVTSVSMKNKASSGVWISFSEINAMLNSTSGFKAEFESVVSNCRSLKVENLYIHVRSYSDSLFKSDYFPLIDKAVRYDFDIFEYIITACHKNGIKVHAWINPYRVSTSSTDISLLNHESPAYKWMNDENSDNDINVLCYNGIYLNPAEYEVRELVINGIREILEKYDVDGIHFDDYFYPTTDSEFDKASYEKYCSNAKKPLPLDEWRRSNVNALISGSYTAIKFVDKDILFTVSPMASVKKNYDELYADVKAWVKGGCVDYIIPQLYFGFDYPLEEYRFENLLDEWKLLVKTNSNVGLIIGLGCYKIGTDTESDREEWQNVTDIIARQAEICFKDNRVCGYIMFSYNSLFSSNDLNVKQRENYIKFLNS